MAKLPSRVTTPLHKLVLDLTGLIFKAEEQRLLAAEQELIRENARHNPKAYDGFHFMGEVYSALAPHLLAKGQHGSLAQAMLLPMQEHLKQKNEVIFDKARVQQALTLILSPCEGPQDQLDALPNSLHDSFRSLIPQAARLSRSREEAWSVKDNPRGYQQYLKLRDKIEFYNISRLLY